MSERFAPKPTDTNYNSRRQSPTNFDNDRHTPPSYRDTNTQKPLSPPVRSSYPESRNAPEMFHLDMKGNNSEPRDNDQPFKSTSPLIQNSYPIANDRPELYHLAGGENRSEPIDNNPSPPPIQTSYPSSGAGPELYHLTTDDDNSHPPAPHPSPPAIRNTNRISPMPMDTSDGQGPVVYSIRVDEKIREMPPPMNNSTTRSKLNDTAPFDDYHEPGKITMYTLTTENGENHPPSTFRERQPSPPVPAIKKPPPIPYTSKMNNTPFPTALQDVPSNIRYVPLSKSKASESILRSMMKYRFNGY